MSTDLLFYEASSGFGQFGRINNGNPISLGSVEIQPTSWTHIADGVFTGVDVSQVVFYDSATGTLRLYFVDAPGGEAGDGELNLVLEQEHANWRPGCQLIAGSFAGSQGGIPGSVVPGFTQILLYDPCAGTGDFYVFGDENEKVQLVQSYNGWRTSWDLIVPGNFGGNALYDLVFYDASGNTGEFYVVDEDNMSLLHSYADWRSSWTHIVPGDFGSGEYTDLLFYDGMGTGQFWKADQGQISLLSSYEEWRTSWRQIVPGAFTGTGFTLPGSPCSDLLFYDGMGTGQFWTVQEGQITLLQSHEDWRDSWTQIVPGRYTQEIIAPPQAFVSAGVEPFEPGSEYKLLRIKGNGFQAGEPVTLSISYQDGTGDPIAVEPQTTQADASGHIDTKYSGAGGGVCNSVGPPRQFWVQGKGATSHRASGTAQAGCPA
ncbi:MAG TPA: hypothetical protein VMB05_15115 [Solirubrobacteraceae bacterium]|nr:hypothetical protein [Solirubrobacteraceae bacterium]